MTKIPISLKSAGFLSFFKNEWVVYDDIYIFGVIVFVVGGGGGGGGFNPLAPEFYLIILAHSVFKMWIIQEPKKVALWNKRHFEEKKNGDYAACLKYSVPIFVE